MSRPAHGACTHRFFTTAEPQGSQSEPYAQPDAAWLRPKGQLRDVCEALGPGAAGSFVQLADAGAVERDAEYGQNSSGYYRHVAG